MDGQLLAAVKDSLHIAILGCGYVGTAFALQARARGHAVLGVVRSEESCARLRALGISAQACDLQAEAWTSLPSAFDVVVYAASTGGAGVDAYARTYDVGVKRALAWASGVGAQHFIFTSSTGVYRQDDGSVVTEASEVGGTPTADAMLAGERAVLASGIAQATVLRFGGLYGPGRHYLLDQLKRGENVIGGRVDHFINYLHREDAAGAILAAAEIETLGAHLYNVTDGHPVTKADLAVWIAAQLRLPAPIFDAEAPAGPRMRRTGQIQPSRIIDNGLIRRELRWKPGFASVFDGFPAFWG
jgi:nucleoside-diphosphate-sugar epimerase